MVKNIFIGIIMALLSLGIVFAGGNHDFTEAEALVDSEVSCSQLTEEELEHVGDYFMEQMHPGEDHEVMDRMMGGEDSESLRQIHIAMAKRLYCNDISGMTNYGMMGMMGRGMTPYSSGYGFYNSLNLLLWILLIVAIIIIIFLIINNMKKDPLQVLKERYAKGEITKKQFEQMKKELK